MCRQPLLLALLVVGLLLAPASAWASSQIEVVQTNADLSAAMTREPNLTFSTAPPAAGVAVIDVNDAVRYQAFKAMGAAMTDSSACLIARQLSTSTRAGLMHSLFSSGGFHLGFIRVPMGASDYTCGRTPYSYDDMPRGQSDPKLKHFSIAHDLAYIVPTLRAALAVNPHAFVLATPWSPPGWMKTNDRLDNIAGSGRLRGSAYTPLANYFVKFIAAYAHQGVHVNAVTPQNEPGNPTTYPGMNLSESAEAGFVASDLAPALRAARLSTAIYGNDYGWGGNGQRFGVALARSAAARSLTGLASHCYYGTPTLVGQLHGLNPRLDEIVSECSPGITPYATSEVEISALRNWASGVALWNFALDPAGQPVQPPNGGCPNCTGLVTINESTHTVTPTADLYELGQVAHFVAPGAVRIASNNFVTYRYAGPGKNVASPGLDDVAFRDSDGAEILVAYDNSNAPVTFALESHGQYATATLPAGATVTLRWQPPSS